MTTLTSEAVTSGEAAQATTTTEPLVLDYPTTRVAGTGTRVADLEIIGGGLCTITMTVEDNIDSSFGTDLESNFAITQVDPPGGFDSLWVNVIAKSGTWGKAVRYSGWVTVQVEAVGDWTIESDCSTRVATSPRVSGRRYRPVQWYETWDRNRGD